MKEKWGVFFLRKYNFYIYYVFFFLHYIYTKKH